MAIITKEQRPSFTKQQLIERNRVEQEAEQRRAKARALPKKLCKNEACKIEFRPTKRWQKFCSNGCRYMAWQERNNENENVGEKVED